MVAPNGRIDPLVAEAHAIYAERLKSRLEPQDNGKFVVINLDTGEYEVDEDDLAASRRAKARFGAARQMTLRVGDDAAYDIGSSSQP